jgi:hypothetical protein
MSRLADPALIYHIPQIAISRSMEFFQRQGEIGHEGVVLWPGKLSGGICVIGDPLIPSQITGRLFFRIPQAEAFRIIQLVSELGLVIPIQIHSHPEEAFHSDADDEYAFIRHENAISIVVPEFANFPTSQFLVKARFFRLHTGNEWHEMPEAVTASVLRFENQ